MRKMKLVSAFSSQEDEHAVFRGDDSTRVKVELWSKTNWMVPSGYPMMHLWPESLSDPKFLLDVVQVWSTDSEELEHDMNSCLWVRGSLHLSSSCSYYWIKTFMIPQSEKHTSEFLISSCDHHHLIVDPNNLCYRPEPSCSLTWTRNLLLIQHLCADQTCDNVQSSTCNTHTEHVHVCLHSPCYWTETGKQTVPTCFCGSDLIRPLSCEMSCRQIFVLKLLKLHWRWFESLKVLQINGLIPRPDVGFCLLKSWFHCELTL